MPWTWIHAWRTHLRTLAQGVRRRPQKRSRRQSRHDLLNGIASDALDLDSRLADASSDAGARRKTPSSETVAPAKPARPPKRHRKRCLGPGFTLGGLIFGRWRKA